MLKGVPANLSPELLKILAEMGHGDEIVLADSNFPSSNYAKRLVRADGLDMPSLLKSILTVIPLDTFVESPVQLMQTVDPEQEKPVIWETYSKLLKDHSDFDVNIEYIERFAFYERAKQAYAILATGESALYANIILKKGVIE